MAKKIAVILVNYNDSRYLLNWFDNWQHQTKALDVELICVDDCSTDRSADIMECNPCKFVRMPKNSGPFKAFMEGLKHTTAEYVACWSSDDVMMPDYVYSMREAVSKYPFVDVISCNALIEREGEIYQRKAVEYDSYISPENLFKMSKQEGIYAINCIGLVVRRSLAVKCWEAVGREMKTHFDAMYLFFGAFKTGMIVLSDPLVKYRANMFGFGATRDIKDNLESIDKMKSALPAFPEAQKYISRWDVWNKSHCVFSTWMLKIFPKLPKWMRKMAYRKVYGLKMQ